MRTGKAVKRHRDRVCTAKVCVLFSIVPFADNLMFQSRSRLTVFGVVTPFYKECEMLVNIGLVAKITYV